MKMRPCRTTGISTQTNRIASLHILIFSYNLFRQVTINCFQAIVMTNHHIFTVSSTFVFYHTNTSVECSTDGIANVDFNVQSVVHTPPARTAFGSNDCMSCRHAKTGKINSETIWNLCTTVRMNAIIVPIRIKTIGRIHSLFCFNLTNQGQ